jgi:threonine/homoserine/homoserine lactone efflux protein
MANHLDAALRRGFWGVFILFVGTMVFVFLVGCAVGVVAALAVQSVLPRQVVKDSPIELPST